MKSKIIEFTPLDASCCHCETKHTRNVKVIDPKTFSWNGTQSVLSQFWCPKCDEVNAVRYEFYRDRKDKSIKARVKRHVNPIGMAFKHGDEEES